MPKRIEKGDIIVIRAKAAKVWENGLVTLHLPGYEHPVSIHEKYLDEVVQGPKEKPVGGKRKFFDKPD